MGQKKKEELKKMSMICVHAYKSRYTLKSKEIFSLDSSSAQSNLWHNIDYNKVYILTLYIFGLHIYILY